MQVWLYALFIYLVFVINKLTEALNNKNEENIWNIQLVWITLRVVYLIEAKHVFVSLGFAYEVFRKPGVFLP